MKKQVLILALLMLSSMGYAQQTELSLTTKKFPSVSVKELEVTTSGGYIQVSGGGAKDASVEVILRANGKSRQSNEELQRIFEQEYDLDIAIRGDKLYAVAKRKHPQGSSPLSVSFRLSTPSKISSQLTTSGGSISLQNLDGDHKFTTAGGSLSLEKLTGNIDGSTSGGSIKAASCEGQLRLTTAGGSITLQNLEGTINANTSGGSISAERIVGVLKAQTSGGSIRMNDIAGKVTATTSGGSITASLSKVTDEIALATSAGSVRISVPKGSYELDLKGTKVEIPTGESLSGTVMKNYIKGAIGRGGHRISASTSGGSLRLSWL